MKDGASIAARSLIFDYFVKNTLFFVSKLLKVQVEIQQECCLQSVRSFKNGRTQVPGPKASANRLNILA